MDTRERIVPAMTSPIAVPSPPLVRSQVAAGLRSQKLFFHRSGSVKFTAFAFTLICWVVALSALHAESFHNTDFSKSDSVAARYQGHDLKNLPLLAHRLTADLPDDISKFRSIYKWVCNNIENDYALFSANQRHRRKIKDPVALAAWNTKLQARVFETLLKKRKTICTGYAYLIKELSMFAGIEAQIVDGYGRTIQSNIGGEGVVNHSWTAVKLDNKWYLCDATWASGAIDANTKSFIKKYDDAYFLADPEYFIRNHYPMDAKWTMLDTTPSLKTFLNRPIIYSASYRYKILPDSPDQLEVKTLKRKLVLQIKNESGRELPMTLLVIDNAVPVNTSKSQTRAGIETIEHTFTRRGTYLLHALVDREVVLSYRVVVE